MIAGCGNPRLEGIAQSLRDSAELYRRTHGVATEFGPAVPALGWRACVSRRPGAWWLDGWRAGTRPSHRHGSSLAVGRRGLRSAVRGWRRRSCAARRVCRSSAPSHRCGRRRR
ncbi:hypothetical protein AB0H00_27550 [Nocardia sp. NPDC023852]|uniref:hypothetical protein n=1 Tax=Nocardia sp. NPDC023852 TaxID=3154697 RepID=UPI00340502A7